MIKLERIKEIGNNKIVIKGNPFIDKSLYQITGTCLNFKYYENGNINTVIRIGDIEIKEEY